MKSLTYKKSGVDIDLANQFVENIKPIVRKTTRPEVIGNVGGFGALFNFPQGRFKKPVLVSSTDGVGTKLKVAQICNYFEPLGVDLVGMNVNDILACGAEPLFFLDYFAVGKVKLDFMEAIVRGIADGCSQSNCALIGGETAEMPGVYAPKDFDLAGFAVGVVESDKRVDGSAMRAGDVVIGLESNGIHSNGFSMVRKVFSPAFMKKNKKVILKPTRIYVKPVLELLKKVNVRGMAHITGGGFYDKIGRIIPKGLGIQIAADSWKAQDVFKWIQKKGGVGFAEMHRTFNMGVGFVVIVAPKDASKTLETLNRLGVISWAIGEVTKGNGVDVS